MMRKQALLIAAGCALLSWPAYSQTPSSADMPKSRDSVQSTPSTDIKAPPSSTAATDTMAATRPSREALLLGKIHHDNQGEIEMANLAKQNSSSDAVKKYADRIIADHSKADEQVVALAKSKNIDLPSGAQMARLHQMRQDERQSRAAGSPTGEYAHTTSGIGGAGSEHVGEMADHQATVNKLRSLKGPEFDREFARAMVSGHRKAIDELTRARSQINDPEMVSLIDKLLPKFKEHLSMAQKLQDNLKSKS
jgi:putative membrane protein